MVSMVVSELGQGRTHVGILPEDELCTTGIDPAADCLPADSPE